MSLVNQVTQWWHTRSTERIAALPDAELLQRYKQDGQQQCFSVLIARHGDALYHFVLTLSDPSTAEDICQLTWLKLIERPQRYQVQKATFRTWLFTAARNALIDELRRHNRWQWQSLDDTGPEQMSAWLAESTDPDQGSLADLFDQALVALPFAQREALMLQLEGFSVLDIAAITAEKPETTKSRLRFARQTLKAQLAVEL